uniref:G-protein alpha subunit n=1 Tax=Angiostrongylus cantonensis TaxID=6313 RepID=A0A0K0D0M5_ANGCA
LDTIKAGQESEPFTPELTQALKNLWADSAISKAISRGNEFQLTESAPHFLSSIDRIAAKDYIPNEHDILLSRIKTTGIVEVKFQMKNVDFRVFDVGGQRSERKKWIHCFEDVNAIIFIAAISEYDQVLFEDETTPNTDQNVIRLQIAWKYVITIIGAQTYEEATAFIEEKFEGLNANPEKTIYMHQTCATDTNQVQIILDSVIDMIIQANLQGCGLY